MLRCAHLGLPAPARRQCGLLVVRHGDSLAGRSAWRFFGDPESIGRFERYLRCPPNLCRMSPEERSRHDSRFKARQLNWVFVKICG
jgi:hypothetical protein